MVLKITDMIVMEAQHKCRPQLDNNLDWSVQQAIQLYREVDHLASVLQGYTWKL